MNSRDALKAARIESARCARHVNPGTRKFWLKRLEQAAKQYEAAAAILRMRMHAIDAAE